MSVPTSPQLDAVARELGTEHRIEFDLETVVLRATGPYRWDVCGIDEHEGRVYGSVTAADGPAGVLWRYTLRSYGHSEFARLELDRAVDEIVSAWPEEVDPTELIARAEADLDMAAALLNDRHHPWSGDYGRLLGQAAGVTRKLGVIHDHVHSVAMQVAADCDSSVIGGLAERSADVAELHTALVVQIEACQADAMVALNSAVQGRVLDRLTYRAVRAAEACAGRTAAEQEAS